jgi:hypothetical protein
MFRRVRFDLRAIKRDMAEFDRKRFNDHTGRPDRLDEWSQSSREARSGLVGPGPRQ